MLACLGAFSYLSIRADLGLLLSLLLGGNGPVDEEEIDIVELHPLEGVLNGPEDVIVTVQVVPDLGGHEDVRTLDGGVGSEEIADSITHLVLIHVEPGAVQVTVASVESAGDGGVGLALGALTGEGTETNSGERNSVAQCASLSRRHNDVILIEDSKQRKRRKRGSEVEEEWGEVELKR